MTSATTSTQGVKVDKHKDTNTWMRGFRCRASIWDLFKANCAETGESTSSVLRGLITNFNQQCAEERAK